MRGPAHSLAGKARVHAALFFFERGEAVSEGRYTQAEGQQYSRRRGEARQRNAQVEPSRAVHMIPCNHISAL